MKPLLTIRATLTREGAEPEVYEVDARMPANPTPQRLGDEIDDAFAKIRKGGRGAPAVSTISAIYGARKAAGLDDDTARDLYERETGKRSLREMKPGEQVRVLQALRRSGGNVRQQVVGPYAKKLQALWISGWNLGVVRDRRDGAMLSFVTRQTGIEHTRFLRDAADARKAVEALKSWLAREGGVDWKQIDRLDNRDEADRVISAQLVRLGQPGSLQAFDGDLLDVALLGAELIQELVSWRHGRLDAASKIAVMLQLGEIIRTRSAG